MSIIANNSYRYNYEMEFWLLKNYTEKDIMDNWGMIYEYASKEQSKEDVYFLADCLDILREKVLTLPVDDRSRILEKVRNDIESIFIGNYVLNIAG